MRRLLACRRKKKKKKAIGNVLRAKKTNLSFYDFNELWKDEKDRGFLT